MRILEIPKSGRQGEWVYYMRGNKLCRRRYVVPRDPRTPAQLQSRAALTAASKAWSHSQQLTEQDRQQWRTEGAKVQSRVRLRQSGPLTGQQHFVGRNCAKARIGLGLLVKPPDRQLEKAKWWVEAEARKLKAEETPNCEIRTGLGGVGRYVWRGRWRARGMPKGAGAHYLGG